MDSLNIEPQPFANQRNSYRAIVKDLSIGTTSVIKIAKRRELKINWHSNQGPPYQMLKSLTTLPLKFWLLTVLNLCIISYSYTTVRV